MVKLKKYNHMTKEFNYCFLSNVNNWVVKVTNFTNASVKSLYIKGGIAYNKEQANDIRLDSNIHLLSQFSASSNYFSAKQWLL